MLNIKLTLATLMLYYNYNPKYILFYMPHSLDKKSFSTQTLNISSSNNKIKFRIYIYKNTYTYIKRTVISGLKDIKTLIESMQ